MKPFRSSRPLSLWFALPLALMACGGEAPEPQQAAAPAAPATPAAPAPAAAPSEKTYDLCAGQVAGVDVSTLSRKGEMQPQLAPAFLDRMQACDAADVAPPAALAVADAGAVNEKGDCVWPSGVSCHYHEGVEFVSSGVSRPSLKELHCIFPSSADPKSPEVFGGQFTCKVPMPAAGADAHGVQAGAACGAGLLPALSTALSGCESSRCCDDGTLTGTLASRTAAGALDLRPDFHICGGVIELDCTLLAGLTGHSANAPAYGDPVDAPAAQHP